MDQLFTDRHLLDGIHIPPREIDSLQVSHFLQRRLRSIPEALADIAETRRLREQSRQYARLVG